MSTSGEPVSEERSERAPRAGHAKGAAAASGRGEVWKEEFSVDAAEDAYVLRRQFTKFLVLTSAGMACGNGWIWLRSLAAAPAAAYPRALIAKAGDLEPGTVRVFSYPNDHDPCILIRRANGALAAFSQKCTHLSCAVYYAAEQDRLECPCHNGAFSAESGRVLQGPPPRPLPRIRIEERDGDVYALGVEEGAEP
ncbi:MAG TPA: Rieske 2Fe-2S domain-containing protein [Vicinamibacterales bacterium]|jgi:Rieske Fe-S protein